MSHDEHSAGPGSRWPGIAAVCIAVYFLSPPIVLWVLSKFYTHYSQAPQWLLFGLDYFYFPVYWLGGHVRVIGQFYLACIHALVDPDFIM